MLPTPFRFEADLEPEAYQKIGQLALRWSAIEHVIGNCLKAMLRLSDEEAIVFVFSLGLERKLQTMNELITINQWNADVTNSLKELSEVMKAIQFVRNNVIHAIVIENDKGEQVFELRNKRRFRTKDEIFAIEELTNYAAYVVIFLREAIGGKNSFGGARPPWPDRPELPTFLQTSFPKLTGPRKA